MVDIRCEDWSAVTVPECGGNVISLCCRGSEILRFPDSIDQLKSSPCLYGLPILLPANRVKDACFCFEGKVYKLPMNEPARNNHVHGLLKDAPFQLTDKTQASVTTALENRGEYYPFPFYMEVEDSVSGQGFVRRLRLKNNGSEPMPYTLAFHAAFLESDRFSVPIDRRYALDANYIPTGELLALTPEQQAYRNGMQPDGGKISGFYTSCGHTAVIGDFRMTVSEQFDHWVLFNGTGKEGYLCIEPQCGAVDGLNNGKHRILLPGAEEVFTVKIHK